MTSVTLSASEQCKVLLKRRGGVLAEMCVGVFLTTNCYLLMGEILHSAVHTSRFWIYAHTHALHSAFNHFLHLDHNKNTQCNTNCTITLQPFLTTVTTIVTNTNNRLLMRRPLKRSYNSRLHFKPDLKSRKNSV